MFIMSLAAEHKMLKRELLERMGADELCEWIAYYQLKDDKEKARIESIVAQEASDDEKNNNLRALLMTLGTKR